MTSVKDLLNEGIIDSYVGVCVSMVFRKWIDQIANTQTLEMENSRETQ